MPVDIYFILFYVKAILFKKTEMGRTCGTYGERRGAYRALVGKSEGRRPLGRSERR
jgi:hypothetical protein